MAIALTGSTTFGRHDAAVVTDYPFTMSAWIYETNANNIAGIVEIATSGSNDHRWSMVGLQTEIARIQTRTSSSSQADSTTNYTTGNWHNIIAVCTSTTLREIYLDGVLEDNDTASKAVTGVNQTTIGLGSAGVNDFIGHIAEVAIYDVALDGDSITGLQTDSPSIVDSGNLVAYWPLGGSNYDDDWDDRANSFDMTANGSPSFTAEHPSLTYTATSGPVSRIARYRTMTPGIRIF